MLSSNIPAVDQMEHGDQLVSKSGVYVLEFDQTGDAVIRYHGIPIWRTQGEVWWHEKAENFGIYSFHRGQTLYAYTSPKLNFYTYWYPTVNGKHHTTATSAAILHDDGALHLVSGVSSNFP